MALTAKQRQILVDNFTPEQSENLIPIVELMQDPYSFELAILQLQGLNLYNPLISFLKQQICHLDIAGDNILKYAVAEKLFIGNNVVIRQSRGYPKYSCITYFQNMFIPHTPIVITKKYEYFDTRLCNIMLPLFSKSLDLQFDMVKATLLTPESSTVIDPRVTNIINAQDIDYPIALDCSPLQLRTLPKRVESLELEIDDNTNWVAVKNKLTTQVPTSLKRLKLYLFNELELDDALLKFDNLHSFDVSGAQFLKGMIELPKSVKQLILKTTRRQHQYVEKNIIDIISNNPQIDNIRLCSKTCKEEMIAQVKLLGYELCDSSPANPTHGKEFIDFYRKF